MRRVEDWMTMVMVLAVGVFLGMMFWEVFVGGGLSPEAIRRAMP